MGKHRGPCAEERCFFCSKYSIAYSNYSNYLSSCESFILRPHGAWKSFHHGTDDWRNPDSSLSRLVGYLTDTVDRDLTFHLAHVTSRFHQRAVVCNRGCTLLPNLNPSTRYQSSNHTATPCKCVVYQTSCLDFSLKLENFNSLENRCKLLRCIPTDDVLAFFGRGWAILSIIF